MGKFKLVVFFEGIGRCYYVRQGFRPPKKNEFYLSGAVVQGWRAPNDLTTPYHVVKPTQHAKDVVGEIAVAPVEFDAEGRAKPFEGKRPTWEDLR